MSIAELLARGWLSLLKDNSSQDSSLQGETKYEGKKKQDGARARKTMFTYVFFSSFCVKCTWGIYCFLLLRWICFIVNKRASLPFGSALRDFFLKDLSVSPKFLASVLELLFSGFWKFSKLNLYALPLSSYLLSMEWIILVNIII